MTGPSREPDAVDELIAARASADPHEVLRARVGALEAETRRLTLAAAQEHSRWQRVLWGALAGAWVVAALLPWLSVAEGGRTRTLLTAFLDVNALTLLATGVLLPAAFAGVLAWKAPRAGGVAMLLLALYLVRFGLASAADDVLPGPVVAAVALVVGGVARLVLPPR